MESLELLSEIKVDLNLFENITIDFCKRYSVCPIELRDECIVFAVPAKNDLNLHHQIECIVKKQVAVIQFSKHQINDKLVSCEQNLDQLGDASQEFRLELLVEDGEAESYQDISKVEDESNSSIVNFINTLILTSLKKNASDIHVETHENSVIVKYRIDGQLVAATEALDKAYHSSFTSRLKVMSDLDIAEKRVPQDGRFKMRVNGSDVDFRISVLPGIHGENIVIRILDNSAANQRAGGLSLENLGVDENKLVALRRAIREPYGMVLVTGPTGSGKTTTLYAALNEINSGVEKIITIEDPVEYHLEGVMQIPVNDKKGMTFAAGLRSILRHDPDKILVGEIRDHETASIAIQSALTGHVVFSSVHANNAIDVLARLQNMGIELKSCLAAVNAVVAQRLVRKICDGCRREIDYKPDELSLIGIQSEELSNDKFYRGEGCPKCEMTGYKGRTVICELILITEELKQSLIEETGAVGFLSKVKYVGGENLRSSAIRKACEGLTTLEEVNRVTFA